MKKNKNLFSEIKFCKDKSIFYEKKYNFSKIKVLINKTFDPIRKYRKGVVVLDTKDKLKFITRFYSCNKAGFIIFLSNSIREIKKEKIQINYIFRGDKLIKISNPKKNFKKNVAIILKTSGSIEFPKYVFLTNENISFITSKMNKAMFEGKKKFNELIFAPIDHAFGLGRLHSLMKSSNSISLVDNYTVSSFYNTFKIFNCNSISMPAKLLSTLMDLDFQNFKKKMKDLNYAQISTGYFPLSYRKKVLSLRTNLFINYGATEVIRSSFLDCKKYPSKIHTEGKPFEGIKIKIVNKGKNIHGDIFVKGKNLSQGYSNEKLWKSSLHKGWFKTKDLGFLDKDGFLIFAGRDNDNVNINGVNYSLKLIENDIRQNLKILNLKILNISKKGTDYDTKLYLFLDKKINKSLIFSFLNRKKINISFEKIILVNKFDYENTGKMNVKNLIKLIK